MAERRTRPEAAVPQVGRYRPLGRRRRLLVVLLALATSVTVTWLLLEPGAQRKRVAPQAAGGSIVVRMDVGGSGIVTIPVVGRMALPARAGVPRVFVPFAVAAGQRSAGSSP